MVFPVLSFPSDFFPCVAVSLLSARLSGAQQAQLYSHTARQSPSRLDVYRLDRRANLGALLGSTAASHSAATSGFCSAANSAERDLFLQHLRQAQRGWRALLQSVRRRLTCHPTLTQPSHLFHGSRRKPYGAVG